MKTSKATLPFQNLIAAVTLVMVVTFVLATWLRPEAHAQDNALNKNNYLTTKSIPVSATVPWGIAIPVPAGNAGITVQDAATVTNPTTEVGDGDDAAGRIIYRGRQDANGHQPSQDEYNEGTLLIVQLAYDDGLTGITDPVIKVFGRHDSNEAWTLLETKTGALTATIATASTDTTDGTLKYTAPDMDADGWDTQGCQQIIIAVETALSGTGTTSNAFLQYKIL